jgi:hypothetical protein
MNTLSTSMNTQSPEAAKMIRTDIKAKWNKFSDQDLGSLKNRDELVTSLVAKYGLEKVQAEKEIDALLKGREFLHQA